MPGDTVTADEPRSGPATGDAAHHAHGQGPARRHLGDLRHPVPRRRRGGRHRADRAAAPAHPRRARHDPARLEEAPRRRRGHRPRPRDERRDRPRHRRQQGARPGPVPRDRHRHSAQGVGDGRGGRPDRRQRRQHRPHRADGALPGDRDRPARLRHRHRHPPHHARLGGRAAGHRRRRTARQPAAPRHAADRHGRRLDADPGRGDRDARRARRLRQRGRRGHRGRDARRPRLRGVAARAGEAARGRRTSAFDAVYDAIELDARRPDPGPDPAPARLPVRARLRRLQPDHRRLADDLGIHFSRANELEVVDGKLTGQIVGDVVDRAGQGAGAARVRRRARPRARPRSSRSATAPTTSTC